MKKDYQGEDAKDIEAILSNSHVNNHFHLLARELDILEPKHPDDIYKTWLETNTLRRAEHDSARANLAATFVSGFVHAGFGQDKLMDNTTECWVYKNKVFNNVFITRFFQKKKFKRFKAQVNCLIGTRNAFCNRFLRTDTHVGRRWWTGTYRQVNRVFYRNEIIIYEQMSKS